MGLAAHDLVLCTCHHRGGTHDKGTDKSLIFPIFHLAIDMDCQIQCFVMHHANSTIHRGMGKFVLRTVTKKLSCRHGLRVPRIEEFSDLLVWNLYSNSSDDLWFVLYKNRHGSRQLWIYNHFDMNPKLFFGQRDSFTKLMKSTSHIHMLLICHTVFLYLVEICLNLSLVITWQIC